ncbi:ATP-dependent DNA helicase homolog RECG, chloroplastic isoform X2 [Selaginella moellendorffii]|uniref:ATP-dependent DNA helicase homolog RECG, chloroplastic isoform X2 n=1 Tax=Selaginella moellendorffii TaxID=88036 RepID=UPI000D1C7F0A|nr:ATP-dependent DNA helicase homolog RECG, chloroplastic isoform X2 [Selaginella moellendorffii]|eukprot:XP_024516981.1 ATP-dependent DNA helicase homolog RECG, chloroplastic isoform X2 [Selaginella moellendorffii]
MTQMIEVWPTKTILRACSYKNRRCMSSVSLVAHRRSLLFSGFGEFRCSSPKLWWLSATLAGRSCRFCTSSGDSSNAFIDDSKLVKAIVYEATKGFCNSAGSTRKFSDFLRSQLSIHAERGERDLKSFEVIQNLAQDAQSYGQMDCEQRIQLLDRVAQIQGFSCARDIVDHEIAVVEASQDLTHENCVKRDEGISSSQALTENPSIVYGSSEPVDLFSSKKIVVRPAKQKPDVNKAIQSSSKSLLDVELPPSKEQSQPSPSQRTKGVSSLLYQASETRSIDTENERWKLDTLISDMKCFTPYQRSQLQENGFYTARSLLNHFPRAHVSFESPTDTLEDGQSVALFGTIVMTRASKIKDTLAMLEVIVNCKIAQECLRPCDDEVDENTVFLHIKRFFQGPRFTSSWFLNKTASGYPEGSKAAVSGKVKAMNRKSHFLLKEYAVKVIEGEDFDQLRNDGEAYPVYSSKGLLNPKKIQAFIQRLLKGLPTDIDPLPTEMRDKYDLLSIEQAYSTLHQPTNLQGANVARRRIVFDDYFYLQLAFLLQRNCLRGSTVNNELEMDKWSSLSLKVLNALPFKLTAGQIKAASEIMWDLRQQAPMSRLLQGDVGCGKTIVAFLALLDVVSSGYQAALMAPTDFVVSQHYKQFLSWLEVLDEKDRPKIALLSGSLSAGEARLVREGIANREISLILGTHALISNSTNFPALGLAVIDEQHRFGVGQRDRLKTAHASEAVEPDLDDADLERARLASTTHVLLMSATPIPRSLALTCHGDMSLSQINEIPPGRQPVDTYVLPDDEGGRRRAYELVRAELENGGRAFFVYPLINESSSFEHQRAAVTEFDKVVKEFKDYKCALAHGRMKPDLRNQELKRFREGECQILVATKVVEVGIDVPEATVMLIESAEGYGLAQLHQLRGRVGRGTRKSFCILLTCCDTAVERLKLLESTTDGFRLAEEDLKMRGPGDLLGKRQSGTHLEFVLARLGEDNDILLQARAAAEELLETDKNLESHSKVKHEINIRQLPKSWS